MTATSRPVEITLTHLRQNLFALADEVVRTGEPLVIERRGVRLKLIRDEPVAAGPGRLQRLRAQDVIIGPTLEPSESPAVWAELLPATALLAAEPEPERALTRKTKPR